MTEEELVHFLKKNLTVSVDVGESSRLYSRDSGVKVRVKLLLAGELISEAEDYCTLSTRD